MKRSCQTSTGETSAISEIQFSINFDEISISLFTLFPSIYFIESKQMKKLLSIQRKCLLVKRNSILLTLKKGKNSELQFFNFKLFLFPKLLKNPTPYLKNLHGNRTFFGFVNAFMEKRLDLIESKTTSSFWARKKKKSFDDLTSLGRKCFLLFIDSLKMPFIWRQRQLVHKFSTKCFHPLSDFQSQRPQSSFYLAGSDSN